MSILSNSNNLMLQLHVLYFKGSTPSMVGRECKN